MADEPTWQELGKNFLQVVVPFAFLATSPIILTLVADVGPLYPSISVLSAVVAGLVIGITYIKLRRRGKASQAKWAIRVAVAFMAILPAYIYLESTFIYKTDPPSDERRIRGCVYVDDAAKAFVKECRSVRAALKNNNWNSDGLFTEWSKHLVSVAVATLWVTLAALACSAIAAFALYESHQEVSATPAGSS